MNSLFVICKNFKIENCCIFSTSINSSNRNFNKINK